MGQWIERIQNKIYSKNIKAFTSPYLSTKFVNAALLIAFADLMLVVFKQPAAFWISVARAQYNIGFIEGILSKGLLVYFLVLLVYLLLVWLILSIFTRSVSLFLWMLLVFWHTSQLIAWIPSNFGFTEGSQGLGSIISVVIVSFMLVLFLFKRTETAPKKWKKIAKYAFYSLWIFGFCGLIAWRALSPKMGWQQITTEHSPGIRTNFPISYDTDRNKAVLFGGMGRWLGGTGEDKNDTWEWDGEDWTEIVTENQPSIRAGHMMTYDEANQVTVLFGGVNKTRDGYLSDTWVWNGVNWEQKECYPSPTGRRGGQLFYDPTMEKVVLSGGYYFDENDSVDVFQDTWVWDGESWEQLYIEDSQTTITNSTVAYYTGEQRAYIYNNFNMLVWEDQQWKNLVWGDVAPTCWGPAVAINPQTGLFVLYGGVIDGEKMDETWLFNGEEWQELKTDLSPPPLDAPSMFYDPIRESYIIYGGMLPGGSSSDQMWELIIP